MSGLGFGYSLGIGARLSARLVRSGGGSPTPTPTPNPSLTLSYPAQGARYDIDWTQLNPGVSVASYSAAPIPSNASIYPAQPDTTANGSADGRFFASQVSRSLPVYAENADGSLRRFNAGGLLRLTTNGLAVEQAVASGDQPILWTNDLTQAAWVKAGVTAALTETSRSGIANSGTALTATANGGTILYPVTLAASTRNLYADIKRIAGSGTVEMTLDGGATWTAVALTKPRFNGWGRYGLPLATVTNPSFGFRLGTAGDQIAVAFVQSDPLPYEGSVWDQSGTARQKAYDRPSSSSQGATATPVSSGLMEFLNSSTSWGVYVEWWSQNASHFLFGQILRPEADGSISVSTTDGTAGRTNTAPGLVRVTTDVTQPKINRAICFFQNNTARVCANGSPVVVSSSGTYGTYDSNHKDLGSNGAGSVNMAGFIRRLVVFETPPTDAQMQAWTKVPGFTPAPAPSFTAPPSITGSLTVGEALSAATYNDGTLSSGAISARAVLLAGTATPASYVLQSDDAGKAVTYQNTATDANGQQAVTATSSAVTVAAAPTPTPTPTPSPSAGLTDTFTGTDGTSLAVHTADSGHTWTVGAGSWAISGGKAYATGVSSLVGAISSFSADNVAVEADLTFTTVANASSRLALRVGNQSNAYYAGYSYLNGGQWLIQKLVNGTATTKGTTTAYVRTAGETKRVRFEANGNTLTLTVDGVVVATFTDTGGSAPFTTGYVGLSQSTGASTSTAGARWDNLTATMLS